MYDDHTSRDSIDGSDSRPASAKRHRSAGLLGAALVTIALLAAACGGSGGGSADQSSSGSNRHGNAQEKAFKFSKCMREHGISDFPDPNPDGSIAVTNNGGPGSSDLDPNSTALQKAQKACQKLVPGASGTPGRGDRTSKLKYAKCMRDHGISDFPDPNSSGGFELKPTPGSDLDPNSPVFQAAQKACKDLAPGGKKQTTTNGAP